MLAQLPSTRKACGTRMVAISRPEATHYKHQRTYTTCGGTTEPAGGSVVMKSFTTGHTLTPTRPPDGAVHQYGSIHAVTGWPQTCRRALLRHKHYACSQTAPTDAQATATHPHGQQTATAQPAAPVAVLSSRKLMKYHVLLWMSKLCAMALPNSSVPIWPRPSLSTQLRAPAVGMAPAPNPTEYSRKVEASTPLAVVAKFVTACRSEGITHGKGE